LAEVSSAGTSISLALIVANGMSGGLRINLWWRSIDGGPGKVGSMRRLARVAMGKWGGRCDGSRGFEGEGGEQWRLK
jgi:hypothetical protein